MISCDNGVNPFKPNGISQSYQSDQSISVLMVVGGDFRFLFKIYRIFCKQTVVTPVAASDLGLQCLPMSHKKDPRLILVKRRHV